ncbi:MAG: hypothetical protein Ct9H300mP14_05660 [Gammaproteobacteria bacterium]|nr:MAG: hypothetical protein Ct9H300mP14_05660 [Gammaproteobacteria bacterium]
MELLVMIDALKRSSGERVTAVMPYYGYAVRTGVLGRPGSQSPLNWSPI